jgi:hypothetical protein
LGGNSDWERDAIIAAVFCTPLDSRQYESDHVSLQSTGNSKFLPAEAHGLAVPPAIVHQKDDGIHVGPLFSGILAPIGGRRVF